MSLMYQKKDMTKGEFAKLIGVPISVLTRWDNSDKLKPVRKTENGGRSYYRESQLKQALELKEVYLANRARFTSRRFNNEA